LGELLGISSTDVGWTATAWPFGLRRGLPSHAASALAERRLDRPPDFMNGSGPQFFSIGAATLPNASVARPAGVDAMSTRRERTNKAHEAALDLPPWLRRPPE
jgi:hypothetical protein